MANDRVLRLGRYIVQTCEGLGMTSNELWKKYAYGGSNKQLVAFQTIRNFIIKGEGSPKNETLEAMAKVLAPAREEYNKLMNNEQENVTAEYLRQIMGMATPEDAIAAQSVDIDVSVAHGDRLIAQFERLPYAERQRVGWKLLDAIAKDCQYHTLDDAGKLAWLVSQERARQGLGLDALAKERIGINPEKLRAIVERRPVKLTQGELISIASCVKDIDGHTLNKYNALRSLWAKVLTPHLFLES